MLFRNENRLKTEQAAIVNQNEDVSQSSGANNYMELLGLSYDSNNSNLIPNKFKWGSSLIKFVD